MNANEACPNCGSFLLAQFTYDPAGRYCLDCWHEWYPDPPVDPPPYLG